jgi:23S rRNA (adenine2030-N6)-methyltransferase
MNYRHAFHAGNFADVFKHTILIGLLQALQGKPAPICYVDTHAGAGRYDLRGAEASRTGEAQDGVARLSRHDELPRSLQTYLDLLSSLNEGRAAERVTVYPGSPLIAAMLLRAQDRAVLCEVQEDEAAALKLLFARDDRIGVHCRDGYGALRALLPPKERRGLVLIDPPFETQGGEFRAIEAALENALVRWPTGVYAIWYPIKLREQTRAFQRWFVERRIPKVLLAELLRERDDSPLRLNGCAMIMINAPWQFDRALRELLPVLYRALARERAGGDWRVEWLTRD